MESKLKKLALEIFNEAEKDGEPVTMEEATEMAEMEIKAKDIKRYEQSSVERKSKKPRERKVDGEKLVLLQALADGLKNMGLDPLAHNETKLHFDYNGNSYSVTLTKHRPK